MDQEPEEFEGRLSKGRDWREIVAWVGDLPPMPHVASRAIMLVENPSTSGTELADLLSRDMAMASRVLKIANSAMFARQREITTLNQAVMIIGFKALKGIVVAATLRQMNKGLSSFERLLWENSMSTAMCATSIAKLLNKKYHEEIFLLGLLHSLGQIVFLSQEEVAREYRDVLRYIAQKHVDYLQAEQEILGFGHPLIGALVAKKWNFSAESCQIILHYLDPFEGPPDTELEEKALVVQLADLVSHAAGIGSPEGYPDQTEKMLELCRNIGFKDPENDMAKLIESTRNQFAGENAMYE